MSCSSEEGVQRLAEAGLNELFLRDVSEALGPGSSALPIYISHESLADTRRLLDTMALLRGEIYHTTFPKRVEEAILEPEKDN